MKITNEMLVYKKDEKTVNARLWKLIDLEKEEKNEGEETIVVMLQEPRYFDDRVETTIMNVANFLFSNNIRSADENFDVSKIYFFNNCCTGVEYYKNAEKLKDNADDLGKLHEKNIDTLKKIITDKKIKYVIDGRGSLSNQQLSTMKKFTEEVNNTLNTLEEEGTITLLSFYREQKGFYPGDRGGEIDEIVKKN